MTKVMETYARRPVTFTHGSGARLYTDENQVFIDLVAGIAVASVGHAHPVVAEAIARQSSQLMHVSNLYRTQPAELLAGELAELTGGMESFFCNSGAESVECAIKLARRWAGTNKPAGSVNIVCATGSFHGRTMGALAATGQPGKQEAFKPMLPGFVHVPFGDLEALNEAVKDDVAAVLLEPIQGEAGVVVPPGGYLEGARAACDRAGALLILDEVQTGIARTGRWFAHEHTSVKPDVMCLAKALGGGLPIGACLARPEVAIALSPGDHASTFGGNPVTCAAALATLAIVRDESLCERAEKIGDHIKAELASVLSGRGSIRGRGALLAIVLDEPVARSVADRAFEKGVLVNEIGEHIVRLCPPLVISELDLDEALTQLVGAIDAI